MANKNIKTSFTSDTKGLESGLKRMETLLAQMNTTMGTIAKTSTKASNGMDKSFKKSEKAVKGVTDEMSSTDKVAKALQNQLSNVGKMPQMASSQRALDNFQKGLSGVDKTSEGLDDKLSYVGDLPKMERSVPLIGRFISGLNGIDSGATSSGKGMDRLGDVVEKVGGGFGKLPSVAQTAFSRIGSSVGTLSNITARAVSSMTSTLSSGFNNLSQKATGALNGISKRFSQIGKSGDSLIGTIKSLAGAFSLVAIGQKVLNKISSSMDGAIKRFDTLNQFPKIMQSWGYSAKEAQKSTDRMVEGIDGLPTKLDDITANVKTLVTAGLGLGEATDVAIALNNAMLANGSSAMDAQNAMTQYSQMMAVGKVDQQAWNSVVNAAGKALNDVAEELLGAGNGQAQLYEALKDGDVTMDAFNKKLMEMDTAVGGFAEQALIGSEGVQTSMQNIGSAVSRGMANVMNAIDEVLEKRGLPNIAQNLNSIKDVVNDVFGFVIDKVPAVMDRVLELTEVFEGLGVVGTLSLLALPAVLPKVLGMLGSFGVGLGGLGTAFTKAPSAISGAFGKIAGVISDIPGFDKLSGSLSGLIGKMGTFGTVLGSVGTTATSVLGGIGTAFLSMVGVALSAIAPTAILGVLLAGLGMINDAFGEQINEMLTFMYEKGPQIIGNFVNGIMENLPRLIESGAVMVARFLFAINENLPALFEGGMTLLRGLVQGVMDNLDIILPAVIEILGTLTHGILTAIPDLILLGMEILAGLVQGLIDNQPLIMETTIGIMEGFIAKVQENMPQIVELGLGILTNLVEGARNSLPVMLEFAMRVIPDLIGGIMAMLPDIIVAGLDIIMTLVNILLENLPAIIMTGVEILVALIVGILKALPYILIAVGEFIFNFQTGIAKALPEIFMLGLDVIWELIKGIGKGVVEFGKSAIDAVGNLWDRIKNRTKGDVEETNDIVVGKSREMAEGVDNELYAVEQSVGEHGALVRQEMSESYTGMSRDTTSKTGFMREGVIEDFDGMKSGGIERVDYLREGVGNGFSGMETDVGSYTGGMNSKALEQFESMRKGTVGSVEGMYSDVTGKYGQITEEVKSSGSNIASGTDTGFQEASNKQRYHMNQMVNSMKTLSTTMKITITGAMNHLTKTVGDGMNLARAIIRSQTSGMVIILRGMYNGFYNAGSYAMSGLQLGLMSRRGNVLATANNIANSVAGTIRRALRIHSPSRVMEELGSYTGEGFDDGLSRWITRIGKTSGEFADAVMFGADIGDMANAFMDNVIQTQYEITGLVDNQVSGSVQFYENNGGAPQPLNLTISTPVGDWKLFVEDITEEQNAQIRRGRY